MSKPVYKIEVWEPEGESALHTITSEVLNIHVKEVLTDNVGTFSFVLPAKVGDSYKYYDIDPYDTVKIWLGYDSISESDDPVTVGKIYQISAPLDTPQGFIRIISGRNQGEILQRRLKGRKAWVNIGASTIVTELAVTDLGLGLTMDDPPDTTPVTLTVDLETYFDVLKKISDYWRSSGEGNQIKKDFYVDIDNNLVWKARPLRTDGVETLTVGTNLANYNLVKDATNLKNKIYVYGKKVVFTPDDPTVIGRKNPSDGDDWTYGSYPYNWFATKGTVGQNTDSPKIGYDCTRCTGDEGTNECEFHKILPSQVWVEGLAGYSMIEFWARRDQGLAYDKFQVRLWCPDASNYYEADFATTSANNVWDIRRAALGLHNTYNEITNPTGLWVAVTGSPTWENMQNIEFYAVSGAPLNFDVDGLCFSYGRWRSTAEADPGNYGLRETVIVDDDLGSDSECQKRAETMLYQLKDPIHRLDFAVLGNTNIKIGDRLSITLPAENNLTQDYDVTTVEHLVNSGTGWMTKGAAVNSENVRALPPVSPNEILVQEFRKLKETARGLKFIK